MQEAFEKIIDGLDRRIEIQTELIQKTEDEMQKYGFQKALEAYQQTRLFIETIREDCNNSWIPVEERIPEDGEVVLAADGKYVYLVEYDADLDACFGDMDGIIAWQPLPEPYHAESEENDER